MAKDEGEKTEAKSKKERLNFILLFIGLAVAGFSFAWHIVPLFWGP